MPNDFKLNPMTTCRDQCPSNRNLEGYRHRATIMSANLLLVARILASLPILESHDGEVFFEAARHGVSTSCYSTDLCRRVQRV